MFTFESTNITEMDPIVTKSWNDQFRHVADTNGHVTWTGNGNMTTKWWQIQVPKAEESGVVLHFDQVALQRGTQASEDDTVSVYVGMRPQPSKEVSRVQGSLPVSPVVVPAGKVLLYLQAYRQQHPSTFSVHYWAHSLHILPPQIAKGIVGRYNCSPPYHVPSVLRCDMVQQCVGGEDENDYNCSYRNTDCGNWIPMEHRNLCFRFVFPAQGIDERTARKNCFSSSNAFLAELVDPELKQFVAEFVSKNGQQEVLVGLRKVKERHNRKDAFMYRFLWNWHTQFHLELDAALLHTLLTTHGCATLRIMPAVHFRPVSCAALQEGYVCMKFISSKFIIQKANATSSFRPILSKLQPSNMKQCLDGSFSYPFQSCYFPQLASDYKVKDMRLFPCKNGHSVHYSHVCDELNECEDNSDENYCSVLHTSLFTIDEYTFIPCALGTSSYLAEQHCDGFPDCPDMSDESSCDVCANNMSLHSHYGCIPQSQYRRSKIVDRNTTEAEDQGFLVDDKALRKLLADDFRMKASLTVLQLDKYGFASLISSDIEDCPDTHFQCQVGLCIPSYMVANVFIRDCPIFQDDEYNSMALSSPTLYCPGYFRCEVRCIHFKYLCDGVNHCSHKKDEIYCIHCPANCTCVGLELTCQQMFQPTYEHVFVKYLDLNHVMNPPLLHINRMPFLQFLNLSFCHLKELIVLRRHLRMTVLDLSFNSLKVLSTINVRSTHLRYLNLSNNPFLSTVVQDSFRLLTRETYQHSVVSMSLQNANLQRIHTKTFVNFTGLIWLDIRRNSFTYIQPGMFTGLTSLNYLLVDDPRLCCVYSLQFLDINSINCQAPRDELSSCENLLRSGFLRVILWLQALVSVLGNVSVFVFRVIVEFHKPPSSFRVLLINLCIADFIMGVYMVFIGVADAYYQSQYVWKQRSWTESGQCHMVGFLAFLCSEVSAFIICIITVDRLLVIGFPFKRHLHFSPRMAKGVCVVAWIIGVGVATIPLLPINHHWRFYSQTGLCLPLPITRRQFPGLDYSFGVFIVLNFVLFLVISVGQVLTYISIRTSPKAGRTDRHQQDMVIARRLFLVVFTDFCCWFPVGIMGLLAAHGTPIPDYINVFTIVFVVPLNSALNPCLYTLNVLLERRRKKKENRWMRHMIQKLGVDIHTWPRDNVIQLWRHCQTAMKRIQPADSGTADHEPDVTVG